MPPVLRKITEDIKKNYIPASLAESKNQARDNSYSISIEDKDKSNIGYVDFENFLKSIKSIVTKKIKENSTIYFWIDSLANELRFSVIASNDPAKSFKTKIQSVGMEKIISEYLKDIIESGLDEEEGLWVLFCSVSPN